MTPQPHWDRAALGFDADIASQLQALEDPSLAAGRVSIADRGRCQVLGLGAPLWARYADALAGSSGVELPAVGDWVAVARLLDDPQVTRVLPRRSCFARKAAGRRSGAQVVAANLDLILVVTAVGGDFNLRRLERYLMSIWAGGAEPIVVINKTDLPHDPQAMLDALRAVAPDAPCVMTDGLGAGGLDPLRARLTPGLSVALVGSSGVGKSTLVNRLLGHEAQAVRAVREGDDKGRHTTTRRELFVTPDGVVLIDTPGMRELGLWNAEEGLAVAFADVEATALRCRFRDCAHRGEPGCAVRSAEQEGLLPSTRVASYLRLKDELRIHDARAAEQAMRSRKQDGKSIAKHKRSWRHAQRRTGLEDR